MTHQKKTKNLSRAAMRDQSGFSYIELIVSISIIALISTAVIANLKYARGTGELNMAAQKLASDIKLAQSHALGLEEYNGSTPSGGWGVHFQAPQSYYEIFADVNDNQTYNNGERYRLRIDLPNGITISDLFLDGVSRNSAHVVFDPPDPTISICRNAGNCANPLNWSSELIVEFNPHKRVVINKFGLVDVVN